jgi:hypothetical protein
MWSAAVPQGLSAIFEGTPRARLSLEAACADLASQGRDGGCSPDFARGEQPQSLVRRQVSCHKGVSVTGGCGLVVHASVVNISLTLAA